MSPTLLDFTERFFAWVCRASWQASFVIALILIVQVLCARHLAPRWRYGLWLIVLLRLVLPVSYQTSISVYNWTGSPPAQIKVDPARFVANPADPSPQTEALPQEPAPGERITPHAQPIQWQAWLPRIWFCGAVLFAGTLFVNAWVLARKVRSERQVTNGAVLSLLEDCKKQIGLQTPIALVETRAVTSPSLFGYLRPRLLLPEGLMNSFSPGELRFVFLHELAHVKRGDIAMNWVATALLVLHWFNPLVWFAFNRMRADRELACDALALSRTRETENRSYGQTIIKLIESFNRSAWAPSLAGILENGNQMKRRITMIANFRRTRGWPVGLAVMSVLLALTLTDAKSGDRNGNAAQAAADPGGPPQIVSSSPVPGDTDVNPAITEVTVTFDRDMSGGMSWTGSGPEFPTAPEGKKAAWKDKRTCALPVKLLSGRYYRVGINSTSFQNFKSSEGVPARPSAIYFTTQGASEELKRRAQKPMIISIEPKNGAQNVDPGLKELRITFNVPMGGGFSWTGGGENFPTIPEGKKPSWSADKKTCMLPVELKPNWDYQLGLNSPSHKNFQSAGGVPLDPVRYTFKTK